jgi:hypothetical protein
MSDRTLASRAPTAAGEDRGEDERRELRQTAAAVVICYLAAHATLLTALALLPFTSELVGETPPGKWYLGILRMNVGAVNAYFIAPLLLCATSAAFWKADMRRQRLLIIVIAGCGATASFIFFAGLGVLSFGDDIWAAEGPPDEVLFKKQVATFAWQNAVVFLGVVLGIFGADKAGKVARGGV